MKNMSGIPIIIEMGREKKVEKTRGKVNKKIGFYIDGMEEAKKLFFKAVILKK